jgi:hypothetical protein
VVDIYRDLIPPDILIRSVRAMDRGQKYELIAASAVGGELMARPKGMAPIVDAGGVTVAVDVATHTAADIAKLAGDMFESPKFGTVKSIWDAIAGCVRAVDAHDTCKADEVKLRLLTRFSREVDPGGRTLHQMVDSLLGLDPGSVVNDAGVRKACIAMGAPPEGLDAIVAYVRRYGFLAATQWRLHAEAAFPAGEHEALAVTAMAYRRCTCFGPGEGCNLCPRPIGALMSDAHRRVVQAEIVRLRGLTIAARQAGKTESLDGSIRSNNVYPWAEAAEAIVPLELMDMELTEEMKGKILRGELEWGQPIYSANLITTDADGKLTVQSADGSELDSGPPLGFGGPLAGRHRASGARVLVSEAVFLALQDAHEGENMPVSPEGTLDRPLAPADAWARVQLPAKDGGTRHWEVPAADVSPI